MPTRSYLDHAATSALHPVALAAMTRALAQLGNPGSLHGSGRAAKRCLEDAREELAAALGVAAGDVLFTSGGTEADSLAVLGAARARPGRPRALLGATEHPAVADAVRFGRADVVGVDADGVVRLDELAARLASDVGVVSLQWVNNETGTIQPVARAAELARAAGAWMHSDAVQAFGHVVVDAGSVDLLSVSAHKLGGPVGIGALVARRETRPAALGPGGGQEGGIRSGTPSVALAAGFAAAATLALASLGEEAARLAALRERLVAAVKTIPSTLVNGADGSPAICNVTFDGCRADDLLLLLDAAGIDCSVGSACRAGVHEPSTVLLAMGRSNEQASSSLRFSFGWSTTDADLDRLLNVLPDAVDRARLAATS